VAVFGPPHRWPGWRVATPWFLLLLIFLIKKIIFFKFLISLTF
jgi:hypothetical protein